MVSVYAVKCRCERIVFRYSVHCVPKGWDQNILLAPTLTIFVLDYLTVLKLSPWEVNLISQ